MMTSLNHKVWFGCEVFNMSSNVIRVKKDSVSINICVGDDLFFMLEMFCAITGQSKTIAVERAIEAYCKNNDSATCDAVDQIED